MDEKWFDLRLERDDAFGFSVTFDQGGLPPLTLDELPPLGEGRGPNPARMLGAAVGHCLSASLLFCLQKARVEVGAMTTTVRGRIERNERGRFRIGELVVELSPDLASDARARIGRCLEIFDDFCIVTESVRQGIPVSVRVSPRVTAETAATRRAPSPEPLAAADR
jgi:organic hydroperoxide reductase OsmC/OhrA